VKYLDAGYLQKADAKKNIIYSYRYVTFKAEGHYFAICLENSILASVPMDMLHFEEELIGQLVFLIENNLKYIEKSDIPVGVEPAEKKYFNFFEKKAK
jgi:hypothetical protein